MSFRLCHLVHCCCSSYCIFFCSLSLSLFSRQVAHFQSHKTARISSFHTEMEEAASLLLQVPLLLFSHRERERQRDRELEMLHFRYLNFLSQRFPLNVFAHAADLLSQSEQSRRREKRIFIFFSASHVISYLLFLKMIEDHSRAAFGSQFSLSLSLFLRPLASQPAAWSLRTGRRADLADAVALPRPIRDDE